MEREKSSNSPLAPARIANQIVISVAPAELIDKITILELKKERIKDAGKLKNVAVELSVLVEEEKRHLPEDDEIKRLTRRLKEVNARLWDLEDHIRDCDREGNFGPPFVEIARAIYRTNDERAQVKREINLYLGATLIEEKSYTAY